MGTDQLRTFIVITGWPTLIISSVYLLVKALKFYRGVDRDALGRLMLVIVAGWIVTMYSLGIFATILMLKDSDTVVTIALPIFLIWSGSMFVLFWTLNNFQKSALKSFQFQKGLKNIVAQQTMALTQRNNGVDKTINELTGELRARVEQLEDTNLRLAALLEQDEAVLDGVDQGIITVNADGKIERVNPAALRMLGYLEAELVGQNYTDMVLILTLDDKPISQNDRPISKALGSRVSMRGVYKFRRKDNRDFIAENLASPLTMEKELRGAVVVIDDITEQHAIDRAKSEFVSLASHQLRSPLTAVKWFLESMLAGDYGPLSRLQRPHIKQMYSSTTHMIGLVTALLDASKLELGELQIVLAYVQPEKIVRQITDDLRQQVLEKQLNIESYYSEDIGEMRADPRLLTIILQNLVSNAVKYSNPGGNVSIGIERRGDGIEIVISDNGIGIPAAQIDKLFGKLFRGDNAVVKGIEGHGIGLYMVKTIVDKTGGAINVHSIENQGTTFTIIYPRQGMLARPLET